MIKKTLFSALFLSFVSLAVAQDAAKNTSVSKIKSENSSNTVSGEYQPTIVRGGSTQVNDGSGRTSTKNSSRPVNTKLVVRSVNEPTPVKGNSNNKK